MYKFKRCMVLFIGVCIGFSLIPCSFAKNNTFTVSSAKDFETLINNCTLDSWSNGRTVELVCDIDLSSVKNPVIPIFCGTFNGNGYKISNVSIKRAGSNLGLFRYISKGAVVENLSVSGKITPQGTKNYIGGIAGNNSGIIRNVSYSGDISGNNYIGGIVGKNSGDIISCNYSGSLSGERFSGGICGYNEGSVLNCENSGDINTAHEDKKQSLDIDIDATIEHIKSQNEDGNDKSLLNDKNDMGGIAGLSSGILEGCKNHGDIGYKHVGYNIGGIVGRQSGYVLGCENYGSVFGRKDVGGIVGQAEPYILLTSSSSSIESLRNEFNKLSNMASALIDDTDSSVTKISSYFSSIADSSDDAVKNLQTVLNSSESFVNGNINKINAETATLANTAKDLVPVCDSLVSSTKELSSLSESLGDLISDYDTDSAEVSDILTSIQSGLKSFKSASVKLETASDQLQRAVTNLNKVVSVEDKNAVKSALEEISAANSDISSALSEQKDAVTAIISAFKNSASKEEIISNKDALISNLTAISDTYKTAANGFSTLAKNVKTLSENIKIDTSLIPKAATDTEDALFNLKRAMSTLSTGFDDLSESVKKTKKAIGEDGDFDELIKKCAKILKSASYTFDDLADLSEIAADSLNEISKTDNLTFITLGEDFTNASDGLFASMDSISSDLNAMRSCFDNERAIFSGNLHKLNNQFNLVMNLLIDIVNDYTSFSKKTSLSDYISDVSDASINSAVSGKIKLCRNYGKIDADRSTGGIVGAMGIEYTSKPEGDIDLPQSLNFAYTTRAVVQSCINDGEVIGKKEMTGGIVGNATLGTLYECENYADVTSSDYVGGIAGRSDSSVRRCYSKGNITGRRYVGGIGGRCNTVDGCKTIVTAKGDEYTGALCGEVENLNHVHASSFLDFGLGAIDGISYEKFAKPTTYDELKTQSGIPKRFISFTATFIADGDTVKTEYIEYGSETDRIKIPDVPEKNGCYGKWQAIDDDIVTKDIVVKAEYSPWITVLASEEKDDETGKLSIGLCEGRFTDEAQLNISEEANISPVKHQAGRTKVYKVSVKNADVDKNLKIRLLNNRNENADVYVQKDGSWSKLKTAKRGKYVKLTLPENNDVVCVVYKPKSIWVYVIISGIIIALLAVLFVFIKKRKKVYAAA